jgi:hypothetical protein
MFSLQSVMNSVFMYRIVGRVQTSPASPACFRYFEQLFSEPPVHRRAVSQPSPPAESGNLGALTKTATLQEPTSKRPTRRILSNLADPHCRFGGGGSRGASGGVVDGAGTPPRLWPQPAQNLSVDDTASPHSVQNPSWSTMRRVLHPAA